MLEERNVRLTVPSESRYGRGGGGYVNQRQNNNFKEIKVKVLKHFLIPHLRLGTCLVES